MLFPKDLALRDCSGIVGDDSADDAADEETCYQVAGIAVAVPVTAGRIVTAVVLPGRRTVFRTAFLILPVLRAVFSPVTVRLLPVLLRPPVPGRSGAILLPAVLLRSGPVLLIMNLLFLTGRLTAVLRTGGCRDLEPGGTSQETCY